MRFGLEEEGVTVVRLQTEDTATLGVVVSNIDERRLRRDWRFLAKYRVLSNTTTSSSVTNILAHVSGHVVHYGFSQYVQRLRGRDEGRARDLEAPPTSFSKSDHLASAKNKQFVAPQHASLQE